VSTASRLAARVSVVRAPVIGVNAAGRSTGAPGYHFLRDREDLTDQPMFEHACHEGDCSMLSILKGARIAEQHQ
jgi:hypothetical protein